MRANAIARDKDAHYDDTIGGELPAKVMRYAVARAAGISSPACCLAGTRVL